MARTAIVPWAALLAAAGACCPASQAASPPATARAGGFRAGASVVDISPRKLPVLVSGGFLARRSATLQDRLHARCLVLDDGATRVAVVIADSLMLPRALLDAAKQAAHKATGIPTGRMLIAATHTHSAPAAMGALGTDVDVEYARHLPARLAEAIETAARNLAPARVGWAVARDPEHTHCRRWILRPDRIGRDPFGGRTVRAMMHPGHQSPNHVGPAGPVDDAVTVLALQSPDGRPIALLANYSQHYCGATPVSADYFGIFAEKIPAMVGAEDGVPAFVGALSQGTSGDLHWMDYARPRKPGLNRFTIAEGVARVAAAAYRTIRYRDRGSLAMAETTLTLKRRVPDARRLAWARRIAAEMAGRAPRNRTEVYAREQICLHEEPEVELKLQALRIGELGVAAIPCEVFGITGLKIKARSPLAPTVNLELANGAEGYIPPPEQHALGGYTTWPARTAGLEVQAEPKTVETVLRLLEQVSGRPRREAADPPGPYAKAVLASKPAAYWRLGELDGREARDAGGGNRHGAYEDGVALYLRGPDLPGLAGGDPGSRAVHFAGGRMKAHLARLGRTYSVEMWFWNALPHDARAVTGYLFSRGREGAPGAPGDHLGIGGTHRKGARGRLLFYNGDELGETLVGRTTLRLRTWMHVVLVRDGAEVRVYLNGKAKPEIAGRAQPGCAEGMEQVFLGGRSDGRFGLEGKLDEVAIYPRALTARDAAEHYAAASRGAGSTGAT